MGSAPYGLAGVVAYSVVYSYAGGIFHYYYLATLGPPPGRAGWRRSGHLMGVT
jgi:hypothetical protein